MQYIQIETEHDITKDELIEIGNQISEFGLSEGRCPYKWKIVGKGGFREELEEDLTNLKRELIDDISELLDDRIGDFICQ